MFEFLTRQRPHSQALHYSFEKAGLVLVNQPIPWNADAVLVEAQLRLPAQQPRNREDFLLRLGGGEGTRPAESLRPGEGPELCRLFFRLPVPEQTTTADILWRGKSLGLLTLPILAADDFLQHLTLEMPTLAAQVKDETVQCQTVVTTQCQNVLVSALISAATSLVPLADLGMRVRMFSERSDKLSEVPVHFASSQLKSRQALVTVVLPRPRRAGVWSFHWLLGETLLAAQKLRAISKAAVQRSLRLSATRFVLQHPDGQLSLAQTLPENLDGIERIGPCFWVSSSEPGLAGWCELEVRARLAEPSFAESKTNAILHRQKVLLSDGPTPVALGTLEAGFLKQVKHFELLCHNRVLGLLPLTPVPTASFTTEGSFHPPEEFLWSPAAEDQFREKMSRLLGGKDM